MKKSTLNSDLRTIQGTSELRVFTVVTVVTVVTTVFMSFTFEEENDYEHKI